MMLQHEPSRGVGGDTGGRMAARRVIDSGRDTISNITTEDVSKYAAERAISDEEALKKGMEEKSKEFVEAGGESILRHDAAQLEPSRGSSHARVIEKSLGLL